MIKDLSQIRVSSDNIDEVLKKIERDLVDPQFLVVDLFCGFGGTTTGFEMAEVMGEKIAKVIACVNHDPQAIVSHWLNHPWVVHFQEDMRTLNLLPLVRLVNYYLHMYPSAKVILWASLECTNFSKAKGGQPRDADSRTLADHLERYITALNPDLIQIENVVEFMSWGPLDEKGKPVSRRKGADFVRWCNEICALGYHQQWKELNAADFGAYTSRNRLFGCFARPGIRITWPMPTHGKRPKKDELFNGLRPWKAVRDVLDLEDEGKSIFNRKKPLVDGSLHRIYAGLIKFVAGGKEAFMLQRNGGNPASKVFELEDPARTLTSTGGNQEIAFIQKHYSGKPEGKVIPVTGPAGTITTTGSQSAVFITKYFGRSGHFSSVDHPAGTLTTKGPDGPCFHKQVLQRRQ